MCGIHGIFSTHLDHRRLRRRLIEMGRRQKHRGPDDEGQRIYEVPYGLLGFGFVRLSILDLETGMQPIERPETGSSIICNGQIYNYVELRTELAGTPFLTKGDIETALVLYDRHGVDFLTRLNGMYAGAIYDKRRKRLFLFRDRFGIKPLYYTLHNGLFAFSSEIKPLFSSSRAPRRIRTRRLATYFTYRYVPGEQTLFEGIKRLPPGSYLDYDLATNTFTVHRYWDYRPQRIDSDIGVDDAAENFYHLLTDAVRIRLRSDVEVGSLISSGIDSSAVAALTSQKKPDVQLFTIAFEEKKYDELSHVRRFIQSAPRRFAHTQHHVERCGKRHLDELPQIVAALEEPLCLGAILPTDHVCRMAGEKLKVVLTGEGADEIFGGYRKHLIEAAACLYPHLGVRDRKKMDERFPELRDYMAVRKPDPMARYIQSELLFGEEELERLLGVFSVDDLTPTEAYPVLDGSEHPLNAMIAMESRFRLPDYVLLRLDKLSMRHSLETRTPFLDYRIAEFASSLPVSYKVNLDLFQEKYICRYALEKYGVVDPLTARRGKQPFTIPLAEWLSSPRSLPEYMQEIVVGDRVEKQGIVDAKMFKELVHSVSTRNVGPQTLVSNADRVFSIVIFTLWYDAFFTTRNE